MTWDIHALLVILMLAAILAVIRFYVILGQVRQTLVKLEETRTEMSGTLKRLESVAESTEEVLRNEVAPTLQMTRSTLANLEVTTRALAETTLFVRGLTGRAEQAVNAQRILSAAVPLIKTMSGRGTGLAGGLLAGIGTGIKALLARRKKTLAPAPRVAQAEASTAVPIITSTLTNPILPAESDTDKRREAVKSR